MAARISTKPFDVMEPMFALYASDRCRLSDAELNCVRQYILLMLECRQFEMGMSMRAVVAAQGDGRLGTLLGQWEQARAGAAAKNDCQHGTSRCLGTHMRSPAQARTGCAAAGQRELCSCACFSCGRGQSY